MQKRIDLRNKLRLDSNLAIVVFVLSITQGLSLCLISTFWLQISQRPESLVVINKNDSFIAERVAEFDLPRVIMQYDQVIDALERFYQDKGYYPEDLNHLVPAYLSKTPGMYITNGEILTYSPKPSFPDTHLSPEIKLAPFTFNIYGHYTGFASMHGWFLIYCPSKYDYCNDLGDRHMQTSRINAQWIWINSSAL